MGRLSMSPGQSGIVSTTRHKTKGWRARVRYRGWDGEQGELSRFGRTRQEAQDKLEGALKEVLLELTTGAPVTPRTTVSELAELWVAELEYQPLAASSRRAYRSLAGKHATAPGAPLRALPISQVTPAKLNAALRTIAAGSGYGAAKSMHSVYRNMFELALTHEAIDTNPARSASLPDRGVALDRRSEKDKNRALTAQELEALLEAVSRDEAAQRLQLVTLVKVLAGTGVRIGEAIGLDWGDLDAAAGTLHVHGTKTEGSDRMIYLPGWLVDHLRARRDEIPHASDDFPICPSPLGKRRDLSNTVRAVTQLLERLGLPWATSHVFRKTVATRLAESGLPAHKVANHLGHSDPSMTFSVYMDRRAPTKEASDVL